MAALDIRHIARTLSAVENKSPEAERVLREAYRAARHVCVVGITGPPGAGKSTLVDRLALYWAERGQNVAVLAIDPTSPFSGGALLGDRVRMDRAAAHPNVFVRSLASRGAAGGLSRTAHDVVVALGGLGFDRVVLETVGAGQADVAVAMLADAVIVVTLPETGDQVQAAKAGILEIGDIYVVNKSDLAGAPKAAAHLEDAVDLVHTAAASGNGNDWRPPVLSTCALEGAGVADVARATDAFLQRARATGRCERLEERVRARILDTARERLLDRCLAAATQADVDLRRLTDAVSSGTVSIDEAADRLIARFVR